VNQFPSASHLLIYGNRLVSLFIYNRAVKSSKLSESTQRWDVADMVAATSPYPSPYLPRSHDVPLKASFSGLFCLHVILSASPIRLIGLSLQHVIVSSIISAKFYFQSNTSLYLPLYLPYSDLPRTRHFYLPSHLPLLHLTESHFIIHLINSLRTSNIPFFSPYLPIYLPIFSS
jgi:hypothetical protein